ncbi:MAG TPA: aldo/keto reductase [Chloroflexota bacterium]|jgi:aryl-alcohol dehydrogenase-like predicted oxidoreductase|nr:aldo/keto reductase [Chloroflexota bacterium]
MEYRLLGRTGVRVSKFCLGCWMFGMRADEAESIRIVNEALERGINFLDTANRYGRAADEPYGNGLSEQYIGKALHDRGPAARQQVVLATKVRGPMGPGVNDEGLSRKHIFQAIEDSLRRLQTDHVDLYYCHQPDRATPLEQTVRAMDDLVRAGKIRYWGTSNHAAWQVVRATWLADRAGLEPPVAEQPRYSLLHRQAERELLPCARELGLAVNPYSPLAGGLLTGKYAAGQEPPPESRGARDPRLVQRAQAEETQRLIAAVGGIAAELGRPLSQVALNWVAAQPGVTAPIIGPRTVEQLTDNAGAVEWDLPEEAVARLSALTA